MGKRSLVKCPECRVSVKKKNLSNHLARVHGMEYDLCNEHRRGARPLKATTTNGHWIVNLTECDRMIEKGLSLISKRKFKKGIKVLESIPEEYPDIDTVYSIKALALIGMGEHDSAIEFLERAIKCNPKSITHWINLGHANLLRIHLFEARECFKKCLELSQSRRIKRLVEECLEEINELVEEEISDRENMDVETFLRLEPIYYEGIDLLQNGEYELAIEKFSHIVSIDKESKKAHGNLGLAYLLSRDFERAEQHLKRALELDERYLPAIVNLTALNRIKNVVEGESRLSRSFQGQVIVDYF